ncbi:serine hydrolase domain-containing protein [Brachybacterium sacelli]|uniref:CubicO group peptidase (Beta-lactamase class C family) n=1 Tax=Brachybacterium sacelli TaxID=173364 RepID=A0ABS4X575_9MICO|nr:serine hydrolase domain-containing protein [Brachybacterium sacelli]MBP2383615.1 CubicO group peptidase (beta-lactamase class C family) [Brachybacterium sacelli]
MTASPDDQDRLQELVGALTRAAASAPAHGAEIEGAAGAVAAVDRLDGTAQAVAGSTALFAGDGSLLEEASPEVTPVEGNTLFDMASVTKVVTALTAGTLIDDGLLDPEAPIREYLPSPHPAITARHLLTHTAGLPPVMPLWRLAGDREARLAAVSRAHLEAAPGSVHAYSCIGFILLGALLEGLTDTPLPELARVRVLDPAGAMTAGWAPAPPQAQRAAATEYQEDPPRGLVRGATHDETAWSLGGSGNAGLFATLEDALAIGRVLAGRAPGPTLSDAVRTLMTTDQLPGVSTDAPWRQGLGLRVGQESAPGVLLPRVVGHPGFTGTSVLADPTTGTVATLLTNRVHPRRTWFTVDRSRRELARIAFA